MSPLVEDGTKNDLTYRIIGAAMAVHNAIGPGYKEEVYERALEVELNQRGIGVQRQYPVSVEHAGEQVAVFYLDLHHPFHKPSGRWAGKILRGEIA